MKRVGECKRCGACCELWAKCPHYAVIDGLPTCLIYDKRDEYCGECQSDHKGCISSPEHPGIDLVKQGICNYRFIEE